MEQFNNIEIDDLDLLENFENKINDLDYLNSQLQIFYDNVFEYTKNEVLINSNYGIRELLKNIVNISNHLNSVSCESNIQNSLIRSVLDYYAIINLFTNVGTADEQQLRYLLYLKDGYFSYNINTKEYLNQVKDNPFIEQFENRFIEFDNNIQKIDEIIKDNFYNNYDSNKIKTNWKFKEAFPKGKVVQCYSWADLYKLTLIEDRFAKIYVHQYSNHVHGLSGAMLFKNKYIDESVIENLKNIIPYVIITVFTHLKEPKLLNSIDSTFIMYLLTISIEKAKKVN